MLTVEVRRGSSQAEPNSILLNAGNIRHVLESVTYSSRWKGFEAIRLTSLHVGGPGLQQSSRGLTQTACRRVSQVDSSFFFFIKRGWLDQSNRSSHFDSYRIVPQNCPVGGETRFLKYLTNLYTVSEMNADPVTVSLRKHTNHRLLALNFQIRTYQSQGSLNLFTFELGKKTKQKHEVK